MTLVNSERYSELRRQGFSPEVAQVMARDPPKTSLGDDIEGIRREMRRVSWMLAAVLIATGIVVLKLYFG